MGVLQGKSVVVTGAGRGLGRAYAMAMAAEGAEVVVNDVDKELADETVMEIKAAGGTSLATGDNVANWDGASQLVEVCVKEFGQIDALVNNAALHHVVNFQAETEEAIDRAIGANLKGTIATTRHALSHMVPRKQGSIINVTSGAQQGIEGMGVYGATKAGIAGFTYALALDMAPHNIRVNAISPVAFTRMSRNRDPGGQESPETVAPLAVFLASDQAERITGQIIRLIGEKMSVMSHPGPLDDLVKRGGWTVEAIADHFMDTVGANLQPVGLSASTYKYHDGLTSSKGT